MVKHIQITRQQQPMNLLTVLEHLWGWRLKIYMDEVLVCASKIQRKITTTKEHYIQAKVHFKKLFKLNKFSSLLEIISSINSFTLLYLVFDLTSNQYSLYKLFTSLSSGWLLCFSFNSFFRTISKNHCSFPHPLASGWTPFFSNSSILDTSFPTFWHVDLLPALIQTLLLLISMEIDILTTFIIYHPLDDESDDEDINSTSLRFVLLLNGVVFIGWWLVIIADTGIVAKCACKENRISNTACVTKVCLNMPLP